MAEQLKNILHFTNLAAGSTTSLPHNLHVYGRSLVPDLIIPSPLEGFRITADETNITVQRIGDGDAVDVYCEAWHSIERAFGSSLTKNLTPQPFIVGDGEGAVEAGCFPFTPETFTIFARTTGNDTTGNGTLANPYRTFQRAVCDVPNVIPPGKRYVIDITDLGIETLPANYQMPVVEATAQIPSLNSAPSPFLFNTPFDIIATPQPFSGVPLADTTILPGDIVSIATNADNLTTITIAAPRASWAADALKGALLIGNLNPSSSCAIYGSDTTHLFVCNTSSPVVLPPASTFSIVEPSATLQGPANSSPDEGAAINCMGPSAIGWNGIRIQSTDAGTLGICISNSLRPVFQLCDVAGFMTRGGADQQVIYFSSVQRTKSVDIEGSTFTPRRTLFLSIPSFNFGGGDVVGFRATAFDGCTDAVGPKPVFLGSSGGGLGQQGWEFRECLFKNSGNASAALYFRAGGNYSLLNVRIQGSPGDAILAEGPSQTMLTNVTGGTGGAGDPANVGVGVHANDGAFVRVRDDLTLVTGTGGDIKSGTLAARMWVDFRGVAPIKNEYDLTTPFVASTVGTIQPVGDEVTGVGTGGRSGSRIYQRP